MACCVFIVLRLLGRQDELREEISRNLTRVSERADLAYEVALFHWWNRQLNTASSWMAECVLHWSEADHFKSLLVEFVLEEVDHDLTCDKQITNLERLDDPGMRGLLHVLIGENEAAAECVLDSFDTRALRDIECLLVAWAVLVPSIESRCFEDVLAGANYSQEFYLFCAILAHRAEVTSRAEVRCSERLLDKVVPGGLNANSLILAISFFGDHTSYEMIRPFMFCYVASPHAKKYGLDRCARIAKRAQDQLLVSSINAHQLNSY